MKKISLILLFLFLATLISYSQNKREIRDWMIFSDNVDVRGHSQLNSASIPNSTMGITSITSELGVGTNFPDGLATLYYSSLKYITAYPDDGTADLVILSNNNVNPLFLIKGTGTADLINVLDGDVEVFAIEDGSRLIFNDSSGNPIIDASSNIDLTKSLYIKNTFPFFHLMETDALLNQKLYRWGANVNHMTLDLIDDDYVTGGVVYEVLRSGTEPTAFNIPFTNVGIGTTVGSIPTSMVGADSFIDISGVAPSIVFHDTTSNEEDFEIIVESDNLQFRNESRSVMSIGSGVMIGSTTASIPLYIEYGINDNNTTGMSIYNASNTVQSAVGNILNLRSSYSNPNQVMVRFPGAGGMVITNSTIENVASFSSIGSSYIGGSDKFGFFDSSPDFKFDIDTTSQADAFVIQDTTFSIGIGMAPVDGNMVNVAGNIEAAAFDVRSSWLWIDGKTPYKINIHPADMWSPGDDPSSNLVNPARLSRATDVEYYWYQLNPDVFRKSLGDFEDMVEQREEIQPIVKNQIIGKTEIKWVSKTEYIENIDGTIGRNVISVTKEVPLFLDFEVSVKKYYDSFGIEVDNIENAVIWNITQEIIQKQATEVVQVTEYSSIWVDYIIKTATEQLNISNMYLDRRIDSGEFNRWYCGPIAELAPIHVLSKSDKKSVSLINLQAWEGRKRKLLGNDIITVKSDVDTIRSR